MLKKYAIICEQGKEEYYTQALHIQNIQSIELKKKKHKKKSNFFKNFKYLEIFKLENNPMLYYT